MAVKPSSWPSPKPYLSLKAKTNLGQNKCEKNFTRNYCLWINQHKLTDCLSN